MAPLPRRHVLAIEDAAEVLAVLRAVLEEAGYRVSTRLEVVGCAEVVRLAPDLIVLDLLLGRDAAGLGLLVALRGDPATARIPVVLCSAAHDALRRLEGRHLGGGVRLVLKPFTVAELLDEAEQALAWGAERAPAATASKAGGRAGGSSATPGLGPER